MSANITLKQLCDLYLEWAREYYIKPSTRKPTRTAANIEIVLNRFCAMSDPRPEAGTLFALRVSALADMRAADIDAKILYAFQQQLALEHLSRLTVNDYIARIKRMFEWACHPARELISQDVFVKLKLVKPLEFGRSKASEPEPIKAATLEQVQATAACAAPMIAALIWVQWHTGMRPAEVCQMRHSWIEKITAAFDADGKPVERWIYRPRSHKSEHKGKDRIIPLNAHARAALQDWLHQSPHEGDCIFPGRRGDAPVSRSFYTFSIKLTNDKFGLDDWTPKMIRRAFATRFANAYDRETAAQALGHSSSATTEKHYIEPSLIRLIELYENFDG